jgi:hypothetical protein
LDPRGDEIIKGWRKLHNDELHNLYSSADIIRMVKSRWVRWTGQVARMGAKRSAYRGKKEKDHLEDLDIDPYKTTSKIIVLYAIKTAPAPKDTHNSSTQHTTWVAPKNN